MAEIRNIPGFTTVSSNGHVKPIEKKPPIVIRTASQRLEDAKKEPPTLKIFGPYMRSGRLTLCFADTKVGKTIWAMQLADCLSKGYGCLDMENEMPPQKVLYYDFELMDKDFEDRYLNHTFSDNLLMATLDSSVDEEFTISQIEKDIDAHAASVVIIDNIMALTANALSDTDVALKLMKQLTKLKVAKKVSILVLAHNTKIKRGMPIERNDLAGSKVLQSYIDSLIAIGESSLPGKRYIKHLFTRQGKKMDGVLVCDIVEDNGSLFFASAGFDIEENHLATPDESTEDKVSKTDVEFWITVFGNDKQLRFNDIKNRIILMGIPEKDIKNKIFRSKILQKNEDKTYQIKANYLPGSGSGSPEPLPSEPMIPVNLYTNSMKSTTVLHSKPDFRTLPDPIGQFEAKQKTEYEYYKTCANAILAGFESRSKIGCIKGLRQYLGSAEEDMYFFFETLVDKGYIKDLGNGSYTLP